MTAPGAPTRSPVVRWAPLALVGAMVAELAAFIGLGYLIGFGWTVLLVVVVSVVGLVLLRREGLRAWRGFREAARGGSAPGRQVTDGLVGLGGALLLAAPGLLTSAAGAALLVPPVRRWARQRIQTRAERQMSAAEAGQVFGPRRVRAERDQPAAEADTEVVEGEIVD
jgi:UPF0716 protein FxsA